MKLLLAKSMKKLVSKLSGCLGRFTKPTITTSLDTQSKGVIQGRKVKKPSISEYFSTTSRWDMDNSAVQSQGSISSISTTNQILDLHGVAGNANTPSEFVNHGLLLWNQTRQRWVGSKRSENRVQQTRELKLRFQEIISSQEAPRGSTIGWGSCLMNRSWNASYESLLGSNKPFPQSIPLVEMVDFLVDIWEQEGLYD
ncbi:uncharacterized protein LOC122283638 isoform X1 [Carya illinoinensis]|uniref:uncharacterized protein LOC122283638 isoform X1 n=2 Tax=Carya illinoinensis TaxID=32201 RepID=UPI001C723E32|nr:uncharacterized protein LOC122283638 isoform X1 [Carya illinoinensis]XP_042951169.1 uncharacterized protein LOC122283638 isoform X1 [Carya illinoinensis]